MAVRSIGLDDEEEEGESTLIRRPRSRRRPLTEVAIAPEERQTMETTPQTEETSAQGGRQGEMPAGEVETEEERVRRERKRKGKEIARPVKKKVKQTSRNVVIQEPVQATHRVTAEGETDEEERERVEMGAPDQEEARGSPTTLQQNFHQDGQPSFKENGGI